MTDITFTELPPNPAPIDVVKAFLKDWEIGFVPAFDSWLHPDCLWTNAGQPDCRGKAEISALLDEYLRVSNMPYGRVDLLTVATVDNKVLTERIDNLYGDGPETHALPIMGIFEVEGGLITRYSDYCDPTPFKPK
nr:limonene-1,2-epoxide hydrolase family protein [Sphingomonas sp. CDS-1]